LKPREWIPVLPEAEPGLAPTLLWDVLVWSLDWEFLKPYPLKFLTPVLEETEEGLYSLLSGFA